MEGKRFGLYGVLLVAALTLAYEVHAEVKHVETNDNWHVIYDDAKNYSMAVTAANDNALALFCETQTLVCMHLVTLPAACKLGSEYELIVVSDKTTAKTVKSICNVTTKYQYFVKAYDYMHDVIKRANKVSFVLTTASGGVVTREFSLKGSSKSMERAKDIARVAHELESKAAPTVYEHKINEFDI